jgi:hypothetical protein
MESFFKYKKTKIKRQQKETKDADIYQRNSQLMGIVPVGF